MQRILFSIILSPLFFIFPSTLSAQFSCDSSRFLIEVFDSVEVSTGIEYGMNGRALLMDVYEPKGDTMSERPLLVLAFGGSFVFGNRDDGYMQELGTTFAKMGYVVASIDYRVTTSLITNPSNANFYGAVLKATHDMRASVRYFRKDIAENGNTFRVNTDLIYAGGVSAGGITGIHLGYLRDLSEFPPEMDTTGVGGVEGLSGNLGYSSEVAGIINYCGAIGDSVWINADEVPMLSMHGNNDAIVPYESGAVVLFNANLPVDGSASMKIRMENEGIENPFLTWEGAGHTPFLTGFSNTPALYMDSLFSFSSSILYGWVCDYYSNTTAIEPSLAEELHLKVFPNPATEYIQVEWDRFSQRELEIGLYNINGQALGVSQEDYGNGIRIYRQSLPPGYYLISLEDPKSRRRFYQNVLLR
ncbi:MAG: T9SS type A sorting domain-containing protein [Bacteroidia bacterium]|nr:T9SS type A sorting domain-containing protein [Bacteroidia bacterium]